MKCRVCFVFAALCLCAALLAGCGRTGSAAASGGSSTPAVSGPAAGEATLTGRVVAAEGPSLLLAGWGEGQDDAGQVYRVTVPETADPASFEAGMLVDVIYSGEMLALYPSLPADVRAVRSRADGFDDLCALYLQVLEDLWQVDEGLNSGITELGVDLSGTRLSPAEQSAVAWAFGEAHGIVPVQGTREQLAEQGWLTPDDPAADHPMYHWENGCLFTIAEQPASGVYNAPTLCFDAQKWRSGTGAYFFSGCTSTQSASGRWAGYAVGAHAIS